MKQHKNINIKLNILVTDVTPKASLIGLIGFYFSKRIATKYTFFRKSINLPALIFLRLFGTENINKITNINRIESINNYFGLQLSFYVRMINQLNQTLSSYPLSMTRREARKGSEGGLFRVQRGILGVDMPSIFYRHSNFLNHNVIKHLKGVSVLKPYSQKPTNDFIQSETVHHYYALYAPQHLKSLYGETQKSKPLNLLQEKVQGGKGIAQSAKKVSTTEIASLLLAMTGRGAEKGGEDGLFERQNKNILRSKITDKYLQFAEMKINKRKANASTLKNYTALSPDMIYPVRGNIYQHSSAIEQEKTLSGLKKSINNINNKTTELILRKPVAQSSNIASEIKENLLAEKTISTKINDNLMKDSFKEGSVPEINMIADKVYKIIEKRISVEKERRGWR